MKTASVLSAVLASAAVASAQVNYEDGKFICEQEDAAYCAGDSLGTDIIIRCNGKVGQPGRCTNNLAGQPPLGVQPARCWQSSPTAGDAACEKNCVVYGSSGNHDGTFTLPRNVCTPYYTPNATTIASVAGRSAPSPSPSGSVVLVEEDVTMTTTICPETETEAPAPSTESEAPSVSVPPVPVPVESSSTSETAVPSLVTEETTLTTTICPETQTLTPSYPWSNATVTTARTTPPVAGTGTGGVPVPGSSGTPTGGEVQPPVSTAGAAAVKGNQAAGALVVLGGVMAWLF